MELNLKEFTDDSADWDLFVDSHPHAANYHRFPWQKVIQRSFGHETRYLGAVDRDGKLRGILPLVRMSSPVFGKFLVSLPFFNYGGLLCHDEDTEAFLLKQAEKLQSETSSDYVELRHFRPKAHDLQTKSHKVTMVLELEEDVDAQWQAFNAKLRNQIRKAEKSGLTVSIGHLELLDGFYEVFCRNMRDLGTPVYGKDFFRNILTLFPESTQVISVFLNESVVASGIMCWFRETMEVPWASSIKDYKALCPNNILYWEVIRFAITHGFHKLDFGRSTPNEGTYKFKAQWGATPIQLYWHYLLQDHAPLPELNNKNPKYRMAIAVWQKIPVSLTKLIGPPIVRNIP